MSLAALVVFGTILVVVLTLAAYPAAPAATGGPTTDPTHVIATQPQILTDDAGCMVDFDPQLDDRMICAHDLGPVWVYDRGGMVGDVARVLCSNGSQVFGEAVPRPAPRYLDDGRRRVQEWLKVYGSPALARSAFDQIVSAPPCSASSGTVAQPLDGPVKPLGATASQAFTLTDSAGSSDLMVVLVDDAVLQVAVTPVLGVPHDPDVLQLVALTAVTRYQVGH